MPALYMYLNSPYIYFSWQVPIARGQNSRLRVQLTLVETITLRIYYKENENIKKTGRQGNGICRADFAKLVII